MAAHAATGVLQATSDERESWPTATGLLSSLLAREGASTACDTKSCEALTSPTRSTTAFSIALLLPASAGRGINPDGIISRFASVLLRKETASPARVDHAPGAGEVTIDAAVKSSRLGKKNGRLAGVVHLQENHFSCRQHEDCPESENYFLTADFPSCPSSG